MIETKFRGKRIDNNPYANNGDWVYGGILTTVLGEKCNRVDIVNFDKEYLSFYNIVVDEKTCGQYTGVKDCKRTEEYPKGQEIYEGDIVKDDTNVAIVRFGKYRANNNQLYNNEFAYGVYLEFLSHKGVIDHATNINYYEVIGNIHDNKELL